MRSTFVPRRPVCASTEPKHNRQSSRSSPVVAAVRNVVEELEQRTLFNTFTVSTTADTGGGSLRDAITQANAHSNAGNAGAAPDLIDFTIPGSGVQTISPATVLPTITDPVFITGYTQNGASANTNANGKADKAVLTIDLNGASAGTVNGLNINTSGSTIEGLAINGFKGSAITVQSGASNTGNIVEGNFIGTTADGTAASANGGGVVLDVPNNVVGGGSVSTRNVISGNTGEGVTVFNTSTTGGCIVEGNYIGLNAAGTAAIGNGVDGVSWDAVNSGLIGGQTVETRNVISGNGDNGIDLFNLSGVTVEGNFVGTDVTGLLAIPNTHPGVQLFDVTNCTVGGGIPVDKNIISANGVAGVEIMANSTSGNSIQGNDIGTGSDDTTSLPNPIGVLISGGTNNTIGGRNKGQGNLIEFNTAEGVRVEVGSGSATPSGNAIVGNSILGNGKLGINLAGGTEDSFGTTANDTKDIDTGANGLQNSPTLTSAISNGSSGDVDGTLNSAPNSTFTVDLYSNTAADPSGHGEGAKFLASDVVKTDANGDFAFDVAGPLGLNPGDFVTATATDSSGNTSEFSNAVQVQLVNSLVVTNTNDSGVGSLARRFSMLTLTPIPVPPRQTRSLSTSPAPEFRRSCRWQRCR